MADESKDTKYCCICGEPVQPPYNLIGQRVYCARHYALVNKSNAGFWRAGVVQIVGMAVFAAVVALIASFLPELSRAALIAFGLFMAIVPALLWLIYFYRQDRLEPEPKTKISMVFATAALVAGLIGWPVVYDVFRVQDWASGLWTSLAASILITGMIWQASAYIAVRAVVYKTEEFDERMDGIVYGTVAGLGVAFILNLHYILDNGGVALAPGVVRVVTTSLAQASFGGLMGWFMAEAKFTHKPVWWVPGGFALSAVLNGFFSWLIREVSAAGLTVDPWRSLVLGLLVALVVFFVLVALMRRSTEVTLRRTPATA
jgi:RsiW-degrading membrane proteinase PrsW (M82 family)